MRKIYRKIKLGVPSCPFTLSAPFAKHPNPNGYNNLVANGCF